MQPTCYFLGKKEVELANHVLQMIFVGSQGFRFPVAHWPVKDCASTSELYYLIWDAVSWLELWGFTVSRWVFKKCVYRQIFHYYQFSVFFHKVLFSSSVEHLL